MTKNSDQILKHPKNEKSFRGEIKAFFIIFKGLLVARNCLRSEGVRLKVVVPGASNHYSYNTDLLVFFLKFRLSTVREFVRTSTIT